MELLLEGSLEDSHLPTLMHSICSTEETGVLYLTSGNTEKSIYIEEGRVLFAGSNDPDDRLGEFLIRNGIIGYKDLEEASNNLSGEKRLGTILVEAGKITEEHLVASVIEQVKYIIYSLFSWKTGEYRFEMGPLPSKELITLRISTPNILFEGIKRIESWSFIKNGAGKLKTSYNLAEDYKNKLSQLTLTSSEKSILRLVEKVSTLEEILSESDLDDFSTCQIIWALRTIGIIEKEQEVPRRKKLKQKIDKKIRESGKYQSQKEKLTKKAQTEDSGKTDVSEPEPEITTDMEDVQTSPGRAMDEPGNSPGIKERIKLFNKRQQYLHKILERETEGKISDIIKEAKSRLKGKSAEIFGDLEPLEDGVFPGEDLLEKIENLSVKNPGSLLSALIRKELEAAGEILNQNRMKIIEHGVKKIKPENED